MSGGKIRLLAHLHGPRGSLILSVEAAAASSLMTSRRQKIFRTAAKVNLIPPPQTCRQ